MRTTELEGMDFRCLEGCGFCCTFEPEVSRRELALLRQRFGTVRIGSDGERSYLGLQNKCGACTLLARRNCTAYDLRPAHCRYFPFHVHFAPSPEVYVNYTCRGVTRAPGVDLKAAFARSVLEVAKPEQLQEHEAGAREAYGEFERNARRAKVWSDVRAATERALADGFPRGDPEAALAPFGNADVTKRPFYLAPDLRWLTFEREGDALSLLAMEENGDLTALGRLAPEDGPNDPLMPYLRALTRRGSFTGSVYDLVDESEYETSVEEAARERLAEIGEDLALRAGILRAIGAADLAASGSRGLSRTAVLDLAASGSRGLSRTAVLDLAEEAARFYDSTFLDSPTIGGWL